jgi:hypothetical protein
MATDCPSAEVLRRWLEAPSAADPKQTNAARLSWEERAEVDLLRAEAQALLKERGP